LDRTFLDVPVVEGELHLVAGFENGDLGQADPFFLIPRDGFRGVGIQVLDFLIGLDGLGRLALGVMDLGGHIAGVVAVFALAIRHRGGGGERLVEGPLPEPTQRGS